MSQNSKGNICYETSILMKLQAGKFEKRTRKRLRQILNFMLKAQQQHQTVDTLKFIYGVT